MRESSSIPRAPRFVTGCVVAAIVVIGLGGLGVIGLLSSLDDIGKADREADGALAAYRAAGLPWEAKEVRKDLPISPNLNAKDGLNHAFSEFDEKTFNSVSKGLISDLEVSSLPEVASALKPFNKGLDLAAEASKKPKLSYDKDYDLGSYMLFPELAHIKALVKGLAFRAELEAKSGQSASAIRDLKAGWRIADLVGQEPTVINTLVQIACRSIIFRRLEICATVFRHQPSRLRDLNALLKGSAQFRFNDALEGEAFMGVATIRNLKLIGGVQALSNQTETAFKPLDPKIAIRGGMPEDRTERAFMTRHLQAYTSLKPAMDEYATDPEKLGNKMDELATSLANKHLASYVLESILFPVFKQAGIAVKKSTAETQSMEALLTALESTPSDKNLPKKISDIPGKWIDPFTGKPLTVLNSGGKFRVYSVGPTRTDHHGVLLSEANGSNEEKGYDVGAAYPPRVPRGSLKKL